MFEVTDLTVGYPGVLCVEGFSCVVEPRESLAITGTSGSGRSTLMSTFLGLHVPVSGSVEVCGVVTGSLTPAQWRSLRLESIGYVPQDCGFLSDLTVGENVLLPMLLAGVPSNEAKSRVAELLSGLGVSEIVGRFPRQVSGGELQRASIARALANSPAVVLADEPTGSLDRATAAMVCDAKDAPDCSNGSNRVG